MPPSPSPDHHRSELPRRERETERDRDPAWRREKRREIRPSRRPSPTAATQSRPSPVRATKKRERERDRDTFFFFFFERNLISFKKRIEPRLYITRAKRSKLTKSIIQLGVSSSHTLSEKFLEASFASLCAAIFSSLLI
jgi:hypothetical protein